MNVYIDLFFKLINVIYSYDFEFDLKKIDIMMVNISFLFLRIVKVWFKFWVYCLLLLYMKMYSKINNDKNKIG